MRRLQTLFITGALIAGLSGIAQAAKLFAGPLKVDNGRSAECTLLNVGTKDIKDSLIQLTIVNNSDIAIDTLADLSPGDIDSLTHGNSTTGPQFTWCKFEFKGR